ncbi:MAG: bi-domain-containing oxidoreductase [Candidatus Hydrogenedentota bacterium]
MRAMKQVLVQGGKVRVEEVPRPVVRPGAALVRMSHSLISGGTESTFVTADTSSYVMKKARDPGNIEKVKRKLATVGIRGVIDTVREKLSEYTAPGYSAAGVIVETGDGLYGYQPGDRVACAGLACAPHAEYGAVPQNLLTPIPEGVDFQDAAFVALGAIAMQGVRRAEPQFGETFAVMGLGLVGQMAAQILRAAGCRVLASDPVPEKRALALDLGAEHACAPDDLAALGEAETAGYGVDGVLVCAASKESGIANTAVSICRPRGRVVVVGDVGMNLARPGLYTKEVDFRLSCSYGPGRYNPAYEEKGYDYPIGQVRWTEGRNMTEFLRMLAEGKVRVAPLVSIVQPVDQAAEAYGAVLDTSKNTIAALIDYALPAEPEPAPSRLALKAKAAPAGSIGVAVIGAGYIAKAFHLPNLQRTPGCHVAAVVDQQGPVAKQAAERCGAALCATDYHEALTDDRVHAVLIATRHDTHAEIAIAAAEAGKHVFVEKPLALTIADAEAVCRTIEQAGVVGAVGFNRRCSPYAEALHNAVRDSMPGPKHVLYRCNAGALAPNHWALDPEVGGGRILGEAVHFFDFACWLVGADPVAVRAVPIGTAEEDAHGYDDLSVLLQFPDGSAATIVYASRGGGDLPKEYVEVIGGGGAAVLDDFQAVRFHGIPARDRRGSVDKGMGGLLAGFIGAVRGDGVVPVPVTDGLRATRIAVEALARARGGAA